MKSYCTQNNGKCQDCSLVNYGMDCINQPILTKAIKHSKTGYSGFEQYAISNGVHDGHATLYALYELYEKHKGSRWHTILALFKTIGKCNEIEEELENYSDRNSNFSSK